MNKLYFVRHGENIANITKQFSCRLVDYSLTAKGSLQAQQTATWFREKGIDVVYTSPLKRAQETAQIIADPLGCPVTIIEEFREVNVGSLEGQPPTAELWAIHNRIVASWFSGNPLNRFPDGDDYPALVQRMKVGMKRILEGKTGENIIVVGHGGMFTFTLNHLCPDVNMDWLFYQKNENCSITEIEAEVREGQPYGRLLRWASNDHLSGEAAEFVTAYIETKGVRPA